MYIIPLIVGGLIPTAPAYLVNRRLGDVAAASYVDITELKPRSDDAAINRYDVMLVRLTLTLTGFTESTVIENYLILSP